MKTSKEFLLAWCNRVNKTEFPSVTRNDINGLSINLIEEMLESYGRNVQEEQIRLCADNFELYTDMSIGIDKIDEDSVTNCPRVLSITTL